VVKDSLEPSTSTSESQAKRLLNVYLIFPAFTLLLEPESRTVGQVRPIGILLGSLVRLTSTKSVWPCGAKLRFGFAQVIPGESWLRKVCTGCFKKSFTTLKAYRNLYVKLFLKQEEGIEKRGAAI
jgi:hypothetical protein